MNRVLDKLFNKLPSLIRRNVIPLVRACYQAKAKRAMRQNKWCNICGWRGNQFDVSYSEVMRRDEIGVCPNCKSEPRQRALFKYLQQEFLSDYLYKIKDGNFLCLEIGPDRSNPVEKALVGIVYMSVDFDASHAMIQMDLTDLTFKDSTFDLVVCSHVLEHIGDDARGISQIRRVLKQDGVALIQVPIGYYDDPLGKYTVEFGERRVCEHYRSYGWDFADRLSGIGFKVDIVRFTDDRLGIKEEAIFKCRPSA